MKCKMSMRLALIRFTITRESIVCVFCTCLCGIFSLRSNTVMISCKKSSVVNFNYGLYLLEYKSFDCHVVCCKLFCKLKNLRYTLSSFIFDRDYLASSIIKIKSWLFHPKYRLNIFWLSIDIINVILWCVVSIYKVNIVQNYSDYNVHSWRHFIGSYDSHYF